MKGDDPGDADKPTPRDPQEPEVRYTPVPRNEGVTEAEQYLQRLCEHSFLKLWSYPGVYRDQGLGQRTEGKELCDLLVVFGDDIVIFSDKQCAFPETGNLSQDWSRWFRKAVMKSAEQVLGAERWILDYPERLYLDRACKTPFPIAIPPRERARVHRVVVAHAVSERCRAFHGGTGTLMIMPYITGEAHYGYPTHPVIPFAVGDVNPSRGFVHVFDDQSLDTVLGTLDTFPDFVTYLTRKEELIRSGTVGGAAGEDELLAVYLTHTNEQGHYFPIPDGATGVFFDEGFWKDFEQNPQRIAQIEANRISYLWDALIEEFGKHMLAGTSSFRSHADVREIEPALRYMAGESRVRRRMLADSLKAVMEREPSASLRHAVRVGGSKNTSDPWYVFLTLEQKPEDDEMEYRRKRRELLESYCLVARYLNPSVPAIVGIAMEPGFDREHRSEDVLAFDARDWSPEAEARARYLHEEIGLLRERREFAYTINEYPAVPSKPQPVASTTKRDVGKNPRNKLCPCGSGKKFKKCCGRPNT